MAGIDYPQGWSKCNSKPIFKFEFNKKSDKKEIITMQLAKMMS